MEIIESFDVYNNLIKEAQQKNLKNFNCYLMPNEIKDLINQNKLFYVKSDNVLQIMIKEYYFFKVSWYANESFSFIKFDSVLPIITDLPYNIKMSEKQIKIADLITKQGFVVNCESSRMIKTNFDIPLNEHLFEGYTITKMGKSDVNAINKIWIDNFDPIKNLLNSESEIQAMSNIYVCKNSENEILGAMEIVCEGNNGWIQKIAVDKSLQSKGIGSFMEIFYINMCKMLGLRNLLLYTIDDNISAQNFHKKFGFVPDGRHNCQFIFKGVKNGRVDENFK